MRMDYGIAGVIAADSWKLVRRAEQLGFSHAWFYDSPLFVADLSVAMAAAAMQTSRIRLGMGVAVPSVRIAPTMANTLASLNKLAPGRIDFGVGTGNTARSLMGIGALKLAEMQEYIRVVQGLLAGELVEYEFEGALRKIRFMHPVADLVETRHPIPLHISAMRPRARELTAGLGAGWINFMTGVPAAVADLQDMLTKWKAAGRDPAFCYTTGFTLGCVLAEGEPYGSPRAKAQAGPHAAMVLQHMVGTSHRTDLEAQGPTELSTLVAEYQKIYDNCEPRDARYLQFFRGHLMYLLPEEEHLIKGDLIRELTFTGTMPALRDKLRMLRDAGYRQWTIQLVPGHEDAIEDWARVIEGV
jgi:5,10-methylenetetrahydromethanopterin reductase